MKNRLAKAAGAEPPGQMKDEELHAIAARGTFGSEKLEAPHVRSAFRNLAVEKLRAVVGPKQKWKKTHCYGALLDVQMSVCVSGARECAPCQ